MNKTAFSSVCMFIFIHINTHRTCFLLKNVHDLLENLLLLLYF